MGRVWKVDEIVNSRMVKGKKRVLNCIGRERIDMHGSMGWSGDVFALH